MKARPDRPQFFDLAVPFFLPVWRRVLTVVVPILWALVEFASGNAFWGVIFLGIGGLALFKFYTADWDAVAAEAEKARKDS